MSNFKGESIQKVTIFSLAAMLVQAVLVWLRSENRTLYRLYRYLRREWHMWIVLRELWLSDREYRAGKSKVFTSVDDMLS